MLAYCIATYCIANENMPLLNFRREFTRFYLSLHSQSDPQNSRTPLYSVRSQKRVPEDVRKNPEGHYLKRTLGEKQRTSAISKNISANNMYSEMLDYMFNMLFHNTHKNIV